MGRRAYRRNLGWGLGGERREEERWRILIEAAGEALKDITEEVLLTVENREELDRIERITRAKLLTTTARLKSLRMYSPSPSKRNAE